MTTRDDEIVELERSDAPERDGIGEEDNPIPPWFNVCFLASIAFAIGYVLWYGLASGWSQQGQYAAEVAAAAAQVEQARAARPAHNPFRGDAAAVADGSQTFATICAACHRPDGSGLVGPSLVDPYWKYGSSDDALFETVANGRPLGMPPWGAQLGEEKIWKVLAYLETLPRSDAPGVGAPDYVAPGTAAAGG